MTRFFGFAAILVLLGGGLWLLLGPGFFASAPVPYLQKFEGRWRVSFAPDQASLAQGLGCTPVTTVATVHNGAMSDSSLLSATLGLRATIQSNGALAGTFNIDQTHNGPVQGSISGDGGSATWSDTLGCKGTASFQKLDAVVDPVTGRVVSAQGAMLVRGGAHSELLPGTSLYGGDVVDATQGQALLSMGIAGTPVTVANTTYIVLAPQ